MSHPLEAHRLTKDFRHRRAVSGVSLYIEPGEVVGLLGPNGAGKTTTFKMMLGLLKQDAGTVRFQRTLDGLPLYQRARLGLGYLPQGPSSFQGLSVQDNLLALLEALKTKNPREKADALLRRFDLLPLRNQKARTLSGGERRRLEFARALCSNPTMLLCDEPFAGIDPIAQNEISRSITSLADSGVGILLTDHSVRETLATCDRVYLMVSGEIRDEGTPERIQRSQVARQLYLGDTF